MKISFFEIKNWEASHVKNCLKEYDFVFSEKILDEESVKSAKDSEIISVFIYSKIDRSILDALPKLKLIATRSTGFDHIDLKECKKRNIAVCNVPFYGENTVAEHTFALILSLSRRVHKAYVRVQENDFSIDDNLKGFDLAGKTIGVIGAGHIGLHVIRIAKGFGMNVLAFDSARNNFLAEVMGFKYAPLEEIYKKSDIITLHVPNSKMTHHLINQKAFSKMKKGAILINTARGQVVDTEALIEALDKKILGGAGLDVLEGEELIKEEKQLLYEKDKTDALAKLIRGHALLKKDNVVFTPHIAFFSQEALVRILDTTMQNIVAFNLKNPQNTI